MVNSSGNDKDEFLYNEGLEKNKIKDYAELLTKIKYLQQDVKTNLKNCDYLLL